MASGDVRVPSTFSAVSLLSNQRLGVELAAAGSATTRSVQGINSPTVPVLLSRILLVSLAPCQRTLDDNWRLADPTGRQPP